MTINMSQQISNKKSKYVIHIIGDNHSNKQELLQFLLGQKYQQETLEASDFCLNIYFSRILGSDKLIQIYDFTSDRFLRQYLDIYFEIIPEASLILYCVNLDSSKKQLEEWIQMIQSEDRKIVFISDTKTYSQRSQIISKMSSFFKKQIVDYIYFTGIDKNSLYTCICNLQNGMSLKNYIRKVNTLSSIKTFYKRLCQFLKRKPQSVI